MLVLASASPARRRLLEFTRLALLARDRRPRLLLQLLDALCCERGLLTRCGRGLLGGGELSLLLLHSLLRGLQLPRRLLALGVHALRQPVYH